MFSCSKSNGGGGGTTNPCAGVTIAVDGSITHASGPAISDGSISATATGGAGFTFSLNGGVFQSSGNFTNLAPGNYTVAAKDSRNCTGSKSFTVNANDPCASINFSVSGTSVSATPCAPPDGSIVVSTSGSGSGFTFNINNGAFQASSTFNNLAAGTYTIGAKESGGCVRTASVVVQPKAAGTLFLAVKEVIIANCAITGCHNGTQSPNFTMDCNIVANGLLIKARAVDQAGTINQMPPPPNATLSVTDRNKITSWITAGGRFTD